MEASIRPLARGWLQGLSPFGAKTLQLLGGHPLDTPFGSIPWTLHLGYTMAPWNRGSPYPPHPRGG